MANAWRTGNSAGLPPQGAKRLKTEVNGAASRLALSSMVDSDGDEWRDVTSSNKSAHPRRWSEEEDERLRMAVEKHDGMNWKEIAAEVKTRNHVQCLQRWKKVLTPGLVKGQWSREEDELLIKLVEEGHKNWGALAARIPGRTSKQCRERWCHHLDPQIVKGEWTAEEDRTLVAMHDELGNKWATIAQHLNGRTENATKIRWKILERNMQNGKLLALDKATKAPRGNAARQGTDDRMRCLAAQAAASAMSKAKQAVNPINPIGMPENPTAVQNVLEQNFGDIDLAKKLPLVTNGNGSGSHGVTLGIINTPSAKATSGNGVVRKHSNGVINSSSPVNDIDQRGRNRVTKKRKMPGGDPQPPPAAGGGISPKTFHQGQWTGGGSGTGSGGEGHCGRRGWLPDEDARLRQAVEKYGDRNWRHVAQTVGTRTHIQCQQRWKKALRPGLVKGAWSMEEDENLVTLIGQGFTNWSELAAHTPGRTAKQCRERWCHHLDPSVNHGSWTEEEDRLLCSLERRLGTKWAAIAREMPGRTEHAVKGRFKTLLRESCVDGASNKGGDNGIQKGSTSSASTQENEQKGPSSSANGSTTQEDNAMMSHLPLEQQQQQQDVLQAALQPVGDKLIQQLCLGHLPQSGASVTPPNATAIPPDATAIQEDKDKPENDLEPSATAAPCTSIARLLSVSTVNGDTLPEITSGLCGAGRVVDMKSVVSTTSAAVPPNGISVVHSQEPYAADVLTEQGSQGWHQDQGDHQGEQPRVGGGVLDQGHTVGDLAPAYSEGRDKMHTSSSTSMLLHYDKDLCSGAFNSTSSIAALSPAPSVMGVAPSLMEKPSQMDYSDLASILMDSATKPENAVETGSDLVTLGGDPYSDYSLSCTPHIMPYNSNYNLSGGCWGTPQQARDPTNDEERGGFSDLDGVVAPSTDFADALGVGVFDKGDPCDPYF